MKLIKVFIALSFLLLTTSIFSQEGTQKQKEREQNKVNIFSSEEKDNLQLFYLDEVGRMKLSDEKKNEYYNILLSHTSKMSRLDDKDKGYTENEIEIDFNTLQDKMNVKMKALLTPEQYVIHLETFSKIVYSVNRKKE